MNRTLFALPAALLVSTVTLFATAAPAAAADKCAAAPAQVRELAAAATDAGAAKKAIRYASVGEKICEAGNDRAAAKKFAAAFAALGVDGEQQLALLKR